MNQVTLTTLRQFNKSLIQSTLSTSTRCFASLASTPFPTSKQRVKIIEVSPRDGLQNEKTPLTYTTKVELIRRLGEAGANCIESGAFVSPKWVPQMKDSAEVLENIKPIPGISYPVLVPNEKGLERLLALLQDQKVKSTNEIAIFTAASESFCKANTNCSIAESLDRLAIVSSKAMEAGLQVRGYISVVAICPYEGRVDSKKVKEVAEKLLQMGCYEVSLGDTVGSATPTMILDVLNDCISSTYSIDRFAAHCHDTMGTGLANVLAMVQAGIRSVDSSVGGLGGCPYSPGATGNIDSESVIYALEREGYSTGLNLEKMARIGHWISGQLNKPYSSSAGRAILARLDQEEQKRQSKL